MCGNIYMASLCKLIIAESSQPDVMAVPALALKLLPGQLVGDLHKGQHLFELSFIQDSETREYALLGTHSPVRPEGQRDLAGGPP